MSSSTRAPAIHISQSSRYRSPPSTASSMAIPRATHEVPPPPLPPPPYLPEISAGHDPGWQWANKSNTIDFGRQAAVKPGSSLLLGRATSTGLVASSEELSTENYVTHNSAPHARWTSSVSPPNMAPEHNNLSGGSRSPSDGDSSPRHANHQFDRSLGERQLGSERQLERRTLDESSQSYDKQLLSRIGGPNTPSRQSISQLSPHEVATLAQAEADRRTGSQLRPLSMSEQKPTMLESPGGARWSGAVSPGHIWAEHGPSDHRSATSRHNSLANETSTSHRGSYDQSMFIHEDLLEEGPMSTLNIHDRSPSYCDDVLMGGPRAGSKRRASSPPRDVVPEDRSSISSASGQSDFYPRRPLQQLPTREVSAIGRFQPSYSSLSSASSFGPRHNSLGSSLGVASIPSSATSYGSERLSPNALLPAAVVEGATHHAGLKVTPSAAVHQRTSSDGTQALHNPQPDTASHSRHSSLSHMQGVYMCECCPKKPRKFDSQDELKLHESEKQYTCQYCPNRFKNKNEAERHQNSLHLRRHSWSCAALSGIEAAFHASSSSTGVDVCGYCGEEFSNPPQWDIRAEHLNHAHKFGECNQAKKFFRADHFRQHLKHSHAGTSGKWTNMLENACMKDEPPPEKRVNTMSATGTQDPPPPPPALMIMTSGLSGPTAQGHRIVEESRRDN